MFFLATLTNRMSDPIVKRRLSSKQALELFEQISRERRKRPTALRWRLKRRGEKRPAELCADVRAALWEVDYRISKVPGKRFDCARRFLSLMLIFSRITRIISTQTMNVSRGQT
jgi:hypothetical protein